MFFKRIQRRLLGGQGGFTLVELLVGIVIALIAFTATMGLLVASLRKQNSAQARVAQLNQVASAEARLVRDLRQASTVTVSTATSISYTEPTTSGTASYTFSCVSGTCSRTTGSTTRTAITNVTNTDVFTATPNNTSPTFMTIKLVVSATGHNPITLTDGVDVRSATLGS